MNYSLLFPLAGLACIPAHSFGQPEKFVHKDFQAYYEWFHQQSPTARLYEDGAELLVFADEALVRNRPNPEAGVIAKLTITQPVINKVTKDFQLHTDEKNGYEDYWIHITGCDRQGKPFEGYMQGADLAKNWFQLDITGDGNAEWLLLGISSRQRTSLAFIEAELRIVQNNRIVRQVFIPGLCVFEACNTETLLRTIPFDKGGKIPVIEASTFTVGCEIGVERAYLIWDGNALNLFYFKGYTKDHPTINKTFRVHNGMNSIQGHDCRWIGQGNDFEPVWRCESLVKQVTNMEHKQKNARDL